MIRSTALQNFLDAFGEMAGIDQDFAEASDHPGLCSCDKCLKWWVDMGPEFTDDGWFFGPFTQEQFVEAGGVVPAYPDA